MYKNRRPSSSWIGGGNNRSISSYGNRWTPVKNSHPMDQNDRYSPKDYDYNSPRNFDSHNSHDRNTSYHDDRRSSFQMQSARRHDDVRNYDNDKYSSEQSSSRNPYQYNHEHRRISSQPQYNRGHDDVRSYANDRHPRDQDVGYQTNRYSSDDDYNRSSPRSRDFRNSDYQDWHYYGDRRSTYQPEHDSKYDGVRNFEDDRRSIEQHFSHPKNRYSSDNDRNSPRRDAYRIAAHNQYRHHYDDRHSRNESHHNRQSNDQNFNRANNRYLSDDNYVCNPPTRGDSRIASNQDAHYYDNRRDSYSPQAGRRYDDVRRFSEPRGSNNRNEWDYQTRQSSPQSQFFHDDADNRMPDFSDREQQRTTPPRWSIDGQPVRFTEFQRFQANMRRQADSGRRRNYLPDYDEEDEFKNLMNKMKIGQREREKLAEELGFNDIPPPPVQRPQRGGIRRYPN